VEAKHRVLWSLLVVVAAATAWLYYRLVVACASGLQELNGRSAIGPRIVLLALAAAPLLASAITLAITRARRAPMAIALTWTAAVTLAVVLGALLFRAALESPFFGT
jgi:hypothetical protein